MRQGYAVPVGIPVFTDPDDDGGHEVLGVNDRGQADPTRSHRGFFTVEASYLMQSFSPRVNDPWDYVVPRRLAGPNR